MDDIERRVRDAMTQERQQHEKARQAAIRRRDKQEQAITRAAAEYERLSADLANLVKDEKPVPDALMRRLARLNGRVQDAVKAVAKEANVVAAARAARDALDEREFERREKQARRYAAAAAKHGVEPVGRGAAEVVLLVAGRPMHYRDITRAALQTGLIKTRGKTPTQTISAYLTRGVAEGDTFVKIEPGVYDLATRHGAAS